MQVVDVRTTVVGGPWRDLTFVELKSDDGLVGLGEVRMVNKTETLIACIRELAPRYVIGTDPFDLERLHWNVRRAEYGRAGEVAASALAAFDMASWDLIGQTLDVPLWRLLGESSAIGFRPMPTAGTGPNAIPGSSPNRRRRSSNGATGRSSSIHSGRPMWSFRPRNADASMEIVAAVREAVGPDIQLMIEMHGRFTPAEAIAVAQLLELFIPLRGSRSRYRRRTPRASNTSDGIPRSRSPPGSESTASMTSGSCSNGGGWTSSRPTSHISAAFFR